MSFGRPLHKPYTVPLNDWRRHVEAEHRVVPGCDHPDVLIARGRLKRALEHYARVLAEHADDHTRA